MDLDQEKAGGLMSTQVSSLKDGLDTEILTLQFTS